MDDEMIKDLQPCKCCCSLRMIYQKQLPRIRNAFAPMKITTEFEEPYIMINTKWYKWRIGLKSSTQNLGLYQEVINLRTQNTQLIKKHDAGNTKDIWQLLRYVINRERVAHYPYPYREQALQIASFAMEKGVQIEYDGTDLYILTDMAAWKISYECHQGWYKLWHCPFDKEKLSVEQAKMAAYHIQKDVPQKNSPYKHLQYIVKHDVAKKIEQINYKNLPQNTKREKKYYRQAKNRHRRQSVSNVYAIFAQLEAKEGIQKYSIC